MENPLSRDVDRASGVRSVMTMPRFIPGRDHLSPIMPESTAETVGAESRPYRCSSLSEAMSIENRYFTSDFTIRS